ncbi:thiamine pyrophosphate-binding protein [Clostridiaceae bacterium UIB06]|uniref:Thiamine pyrophosphate-binding protein n=1 Tax=Clostridium thailandense TaxID=2794346 RepID=A0A949TVV2_9CLOT|nr:thiamine pyrophosphate-binding protein [Clostridium thailandense]MBV7272806.1 thiamine pyrophosphate-binding protein [Clostridium thailandense]MCH5137653.1 thiamine pyrophosphate-binding protein [Clostridiaceae bacterium UIB06]
MKIKVAKYIADFMVANGIKHVFTITGGGAMHLNDAFGHHHKLHCIYNHNEQAASIAAEGYTRLTGKLALICVTSGPGGTNAITGVLGGWLDSIPMFVVSGQVKRETTTWSTEVPLRQLGDQEYNIVASVSSMTKYAHMITEPLEIRYHLEKALYLALNGRGGPVWLDVPLDVQAAIVETDDLVGFSSNEIPIENPVYDKNLTSKILEKIKQAKRPVIIAGSGIRLGSAYDEFISLIEKLKIPVTTAWNAHDLLWDDHPLFCGRPGTIGTRGGNFIVENSDLIFVLGCRLNIRQISYNYRNYAKNAYKIIVDIDKNELKKPTIKPDLPVWANVKDLMVDIVDSDYKAEEESHSRWLKWCRNINAKYPAVLPKYYEKINPVNPYAFINELFEELEEGENIITGNGSACVITFQAAKIKRGQRIFTNSGCASMGYGFPAALGGCTGTDGKRVICIDGDGSFQMNIQELQTVVYNKMNIKILYLNNDGYLSIRQTQNNLFDPPLVGVCDENGVSFPDMNKIAWAYGIPYIKINNINEVRTLVRKMLDIEGPVICEVIIDPSQNFEPKLSSKVLPDGKIVSPYMDDMFPFLDKTEYAENKNLDLI